MSLNVAARALNTNQSVLQVIGHNIANANTVGYSRQNVSLTAVEGQQSGGGFYGKGVAIADVSRSYDAFLTRQANATQTVASADTLRYEKLQQVESLFPLGAGSLGTMLNSALNAWVDVQASPSDSTARQVVIDRSDELAARIRDTSLRLNEITTTSKLQASEVVKSINQLAEQIATLNDKITSVIGSGAAPNDLLDQRDQLIAKLGTQVKVNTIAADDGSLTVFVASSYPLVLGSKAGQLAIGRDTLDPNNRQVINFVQGGSQSRIPDDFLVGGELKGLQDFINHDMPLVQAELGRMALALAVEMNNQHQSGLQADGSRGGAFFNFETTLTPSKTPAPFALEFTALGLKADDYAISYSALGQATIQRQSDGMYWDPVAGAFQTNAYNIDFTSLPGGEITFDGLVLTPDALNQGTAGERFLLRPAADAARSLTVAPNVAAEVAVASHVSVSAPATNLGTTTIEAVGLSLERGSLPTPVPVFDVQFNSATGQFGIVGAAPANIQAPTSVTYTAGQPLVWTYDDGATPPNRFTYELTLRGEPKNGDRFNLSLTTASSTPFNGGNAQRILAMRDQTIFDGATTLADSYVAVFSGVASQLRESKFSAEFSTAQAASAESQRANQSGVNLDEEAAKLIQYQQAYQASAKYMGTVQSLFDTLMSAFR